MQVFAVKKLDLSVAQVQDKEEFLAAVCTMAHLQHANITKLVGYCVDHGQRLLVYQYINRGTLNDALHTSEEAAKRISWNMRIKIALGAARALEYGFSSWNWAVGLIEEIDGLLRNTEIEVDEKIYASNSVG